MRIPEKLKNFDDQVTAMFRMLTTMIVMLKMDLVPQPDERLDSIMAEIAVLNANVERLNSALTGSIDSLRSVTGRLLENQMDDFATRMKERRKDKE